MAKVLPAFVSVRDRYPWKLWTDGRTYQAIKGTDFHCDHFRATLDSYARRHGFTVRIAYSKDTPNQISFQFTKKPRNGKRGRK